MNQKYMSRTHEQQMAGGTRQQPQSNSLLSLGSGLFDLYSMFGGGAAGGTSAAGGASAGGAIAPEVGSAGLCGLGAMGV